MSSNDKFICYLIVFQQLFSYSHENHREIQIMISIKYQLELILY